MIIYCVKCQTGYGFDAIMKYFYSEAEAEEYAKLVNNKNPGLDAYISDIEVNRLLRSQKNDSI